jgi:hypothetical protein
LDLEKLNIFLEEYQSGIIAGLIVTVITLTLSKILKFFKNLKISSKYSGYIGYYYLYETSSTGNNKIVKYDVIIKKNFFGKLVIYVKNNTYSYSGNMFITERNLYLCYKGINHIEITNIVFHSPLHRNIKKIVGVICAISPIDEPVAKYCLLSSSKVSEEEILQKFEYLKDKQSGNLLKIPKDMSGYIDNLETDMLNKTYDINN